MARIVFNFEDGVTRFVESLAGETIAETAYRLGMNIPLDCADGACGTCKCFCPSGRFDPGDYIEDVLSKEELDKGFGLACQMRPETDMVVNVFASSTACKYTTKAFPTVISGLDFLSSEIVKLTVKVEDGTPVSFLPGQYANIEVPDSGLTRSYSFSNKSDGNELEFIIRVVPDGLMSNYLRDKAAVGQTLSVTAPLGSFYLREISQPTLFFAGGTGIAPFLAMLEKLNQEQSTQPITLYYGATAEENLVELDRLNQMASNLNFKFECCVQVQESGKYAEGFVTQWINKECLKESNYDIYICGPNPMVEAVKGQLEKEEIKYSNFYLEKFVPTGVA